MARAATLLLLAAAALAQHTPSGDSCTSFTLAGNGTFGFSDSPNNATFRNPRSIALDPASGLLVLSEFAGHRIRRLSTVTGNVSTLAGIGTAGVIDGPGSSAAFNTPLGVSVNATGFVAVADSSSNRIRLVAPPPLNPGTTFGWGTVSTIAGWGGSGYADGPAAYALFNNPRGVAWGGAGGLYISEYNGCRVRFLSAGGVVSTLAGGMGACGYSDGVGTNALFTSPGVLAFDAGAASAREAPLLAVADVQNNRVRLMTPGGVVTTLGGSGANGYAEGVGTAAIFFNPSALVWVPTTPTQPRFLVVCDANNNRVRALYLNGTTALLAGGATASFAEGVGAGARFSNPSGVALNASGALFIGDNNNNRVRGLLCVASSGVAPSATATATPGAAPTASGTPSATPSPSPAPGGCTLSTITGAPGWNNYAANADPYLVRMGSTLSLALNGSTSTLLVLDQPYHQLSSVALASGAQTSLVGTTTAGFVNGAAGAVSRFSAPAGLVAGCGYGRDIPGWGGAVYVADSNNFRVRGVLFNLSTATLAGNGSAMHADGPLLSAAFLAPTALACARDGSLLVADGFRVRALPLGAGAVATLAGGAGAGAADGYGTAALFSASLRGLAVRNSSGDLYIADTGNSRVRVLHLATGYVATLVGGAGAAGWVDGPAAFAQVSAPWGLAFDALENLYVADSGNHAIRLLSPGGAVATVAGGSGVAGWADGPALGARLNAPKGLAILPSTGALLVGDSNVLRQLACPATPSPSAGASPSRTPTRTGTASGTGSPTPTRSPSASGAPPRPACALGPLAGAAGTIGFADALAAGAALFNSPQGLSHDAGNATRRGALYIGDSVNHRVRALLANGSVVTVAGTGVDGFSGDGGPPLLARLSQPKKAELDPLTGDLNIVDYSNGRIRRVWAATGRITSLAGNGPGFADGIGTAGLMSGPTDVATHPTTRVLYVADTNNNRIRTLTAVPGGGGAHAVATLCGGAAAGYLDGLGVAAQLSKPWGVALNTAAGLLYVSDSGNNRVRVVALATGAVGTLAGSGAGASLNGVGGTAAFNSPRYLTFDAANQALYVATGGWSVFACTPGGACAVVAGTGFSCGFSTNANALSACLLSPFAAALLPPPSPGFVSLAISDGNTCAIRNLTCALPRASASPSPGAPPSPSATPSPSAPATRTPTPTPFPGGGCVVGTFAGWQNRSSGQSVVAGAVGVSSPSGLALGPLTGNVYWSETGAVTGAGFGNRIRVATPGGSVSTIAGTPGPGGFADGPAAAVRFNLPRAIALDAAETVLYVADDTNCRIRRVYLGNGTTDTLTGTGALGARDGPPYLATFRYPHGLAFLTPQVLLVADTANHIIRAVHAATGVVSTYAGTCCTAGSVDSPLPVQFNAPWSVAADPANGGAYVSEDVGLRVRYVSAAGLVSTLAGSGHSAWGDGFRTFASFGAPRGMAVDPGSGNLLIADSGSGTVRVLTPGGVVSTLAGLGTDGAADGPVGVAGFSAEPSNSGASGPFHIALRPTGVILLTDPGNHAIRTITCASASSASASATRSATLGSSPTASPSPLPRVAASSPTPTPTATPFGCRMTALAGNPAASGGFADGAGSNAVFSSPFGLRADAPARGAGVLLVSDSSNNRSACKLSCDCSLVHAPSPPPHPPPPPPLFRHPPHSSPCLSQWHRDLAVGEQYERLPGWDGTPF